VGSSGRTRAGHIYSENSVPAATLPPFNPDSDLHLGSIGVGKRGEVWSWTVGYHFAYNVARVGRGNIPNPISGQSANGEFKSCKQAVKVSVRRGPSVAGARVTHSMKNDQKSSFSTRSAARSSKASSGARSMRETSNLI